MARRLPPKERKMANTNIKKQKDSTRVKKNPLFITVAVIAAIAISAGIVLGIVSLVRSSRAIMQYEGVRMERGVASYLISIYKTDHIAALKASGVSYASDSDEFWSKQNPDGTGTFGEGFERAAEAYLKEILVGVYLYDRNAELSKKVEEAIEKNANQVAEFYYKSEGFEARFEADAKKMGYDYKSYLEAAKMLYKSSMAWSVIYGSNGEAAANLPSECYEYLKSAYSHVELAFVRTKSTFKLDEDGGRVENMGTYVLDDLSDKQEAERLERVDFVKSLIDNYNSGISTDTVITPATIEALAKDYKSDQSVERISKGYYFSLTSEYTESFLSGYRNDLTPVVTAANNLKLDSKGNAFGVCELSLDGIDGKETVYCFIYKSEPAENAYADAELSDFFTDFFSDAVKYYIHPKDVAARSLEVKVKDKFYEMPILTIPQNNIHRIKQYI